MIILLSPAKSLNFSEMNCCKRNNYSSLPFFINEAEYIVNILRQLSKEQFRLNLGLSKNIGLLNYLRYQNWKNFCMDEQFACHAIFAFNGDVYKKLDVFSLQKSALDFLQKHLRILSGLYGILKPYDLIQPYRLEMGAKLRINDVSLYDYWSEKVTANMQSEIDNFLKQEGKNCLPTILNLASREYFKVLNLKNIKARIITPIFQDYKNDKYQIIGTNAKRARGLMLKFISSFQCKKLDEIKLFNEQGYKFDPLVSSNSDWVFRRKNIRADSIV